MGQGGASSAAVDLGRGLSPAGPDWRGWAPDQEPRLRAWVQTRWGRVALVASFAAAALLGGLALPYVLAAAAFAYWPAHRGPIALAAAAVGLVRSSDKWPQLLAPLLAEAGMRSSAAQGLALAVLAAYLAAAWWALVWTRSHPGFVLARRPVLVQGAGAVLLACLASLPVWSGPVRLGLWMLLSVWGSHMWVLAYALQDQRSRAAGPLMLQMGWFHPFWRASLGSLAPTPFGKGAAFLRKYQAQDADALALTQLKAVKLLIWALVLGLMNTGLLALAARLGIPSIDATFAAFLAGRPHPLALNWASLAVSAASAALALAVVGHKLIAVARLAGFRLPRSTWRPLEARTLADFWNRYYYYFKELLVDFFFFPTFLKVFRQHPRLRVFFATFMAAGVGNAAFHFLRDIHLVATLGWRDACVGYLGNLFYCAVLAVGIGLSQTRLTAGRRLAEGWPARLWQGACVWSFFVVTQPFGYESRAFAFTDRWNFFLGLFGA